MTQLTPTGAQCTENLAPLEMEFAVTEGAKYLLIPEEKQEKIEQGSIFPTDRSWVIFQVDQENHVVAALTLYLPKNISFRFCVEPIPEFTIENDLLKLKLQVQDPTELCNVQYVWDGSENNTEPDSTQLPLDELGFEN